MHVAAFNPLCLSKDDLDSEVLEREKAIYMVQAEESGKPKEIMEKMIEGKLNRYLSEVSLLSQSFVKDPDLSIQDLLDKNSASIHSFSRLKVGEGIEVETKNVGRPMPLAMVQNRRKAETARMRPSGWSLPLSAKPAPSAHMTFSLKK